MSFPDLMLALALLALGWVLAGFLASLRDEVCDRFTRWAFPPSQALTFRLAATIVKASRAMAPSVHIRKPDKGFATQLETMCYGFRYIWWQVCFHQYERRWDAPDSAIARLDAALETGERIRRPLRSALPVLAEALRRRKRNWTEAAKAIPRCLALDSCVVRFRLPRLSCLRPVVSDDAAP
jgi:hypothetical protein